MGFDVSPGAYARFMGRYSEPLADRFVELAEVRAGQQALDVGCGPGALTSRLVDRLGAGAVRAIDPSASFVAALGERLPGVDVRLGSAENLPWPDDVVDVALAQLVVHFMADPVAGLREMLRVTRPGGVVAACVWDHGGGTGPLSPIWRAVTDLDPSVPTEALRPGSVQGHLTELLTAAGADDVRETSATVTVTYADLDEWWAPMLAGVGTVGDHVTGLGAPQRAALRARLGEIAGPAPFEVSGTAWCVIGRA
jgi:SAM-dependent methyltransferase